MDFKQSVISVFAKYKTLSGRARRSEFWYFALFQLLLGIATAVIDTILFGGHSVVSYLTFALAIPGLTVSVRRLHDIGKSGWWYLLILVPIVGCIVLLYWFAQDGTVGSNQYGTSPKEELALAV